MPDERCADPRHRYAAFNIDTLAWKCGACLRTTGRPTWAPRDFLGFCDWIANGGAIGPPWMGAPDGPE